MRRVGPGVPLNPYQPHRIKLVVFSAPGCVFCGPFKSGPLAKFQKAHPDLLVEQPVLFEGVVDKDAAKLWAKLGLSSVPTSVFVGPRGGIRCVLEGAVTYVQLEEGWRIATGRPAKKEKR